MRINQKKSAAYLKQHGREIFLGKDQTYDITKAAYVIEQSGRESHTVSVLVEPSLFYQAVITEYKRLGKAAAIPDEWRRKAKE